MTIGVTQWLKSFSFKISSEYLKSRLESHPDYPSLTAIQDTLDELGIQSWACHGSIEDLRSENKPFLAHLNIGNGEVRFFQSLKDAEQREKNFSKIWSGNVMFLKKPEVYGNPEHDRQYRSEKKQYLGKIIIFAIFFLCISGLAFYKNNIPLLILFFTNVIGFGLSWLIVQKEFGIRSNVADKICSVSKKSQCEAVILSKGAKLFNWLTWGDIGILYFTFSLVYLLFALITNYKISLQLYYFISVSGLIFPLYSVYYQMQVVKQWCVLCLGVITILALSGTISILQYTGYYDLRLLWKDIIVVLSTVIFLLSLWYLIKEMIQKNLLFAESSRRSLKFRRDPAVFNALLNRQNEKVGNLPNINEAIVFGNSNAISKITIACSPFCGPCVKAHRALESIYKKYPDKMQIAYRFVLETNDSNNNRTEIAKEVVRRARQNPHNAIQNWYRILDINHFRKEFKCDIQIDVSEDIENYIHWSTVENIVATPTFFINGRLLPPLYSWAEFLEITEYEFKEN